MKKALFRILNVLQLTRFCAYPNRRKILILAYRGFTDKTYLEGIQNHQGMQLEIARFRRHVQYLSSHYNVVSLEQVVTHFRKGTPMPEYSVVKPLEVMFRKEWLKSAWRDSRASLQRTSL